MKIKAKTGYKVTFWFFVVFTVIAYLWTLASLIWALASLIWALVK